MKKTPNRRKGSKDELKPEYRFDYRKAKPNRFAAAIPEHAVVVVLEPDVAAVFNSSKTVNSLLRSVISAMPETQAPKRRLTKR
jgi:hypothetical protein